MGPRPPGGPHPQGDALEETNPPTGATPDPHQNTSAKGVAGPKRLQARNHPGRSAIQDIAVTQKGLPIHINTMQQLGQRRTTGYI